MAERKNPVIYIASDSAGETGESVVRAAAVQFYPQQVDVRVVPFLENHEGIDRLIQTAKERDGIIVFTLVIPELRDYLVEQSIRNQLKYIDLLGPILGALEKKLQQESRHQPGMIHPLDEDYFKKVEAVEFAVKYDDGRDFTGVLQADIVLVGVSRTSKTPLSMYLAHKKFKVANVPLVPEIQPPEQLFSVSSKKIIGLRITPEKLNIIRSERLKTLGLPQTAMYANVERINLELEYADKIMKRIGCTVIDVSNKAVEETASLIIDWYHGR
ncbi:pyruvate, phosphate dikinase/phosphoenolpyruvate synthase regulator [Paenibacillus sp. LMG 31456]|uniref:Putative pyruvate, phosphate dikinase regulatory protein n=1 Tax=Paenibacillus foliorum TaxID=2654974 RepID=A0A972K185_9BACL|nr:pyruvate, water dikinase regulatory protein [Paenibacillus foliorum]NOU95451.1 pyruvate, phosphate dikinase/phosphoenolpyruvate synthase regulator [Paenibacillus foliorum]